MNRRQFILLFGGGSAAATSVGTGAFSSVEADREVSVNVVEDDEAYLGLGQVNHTVSSDEATKVVQITNGFAGPLTLTVTITQRDEIIDEIEGRGITVGDEGDDGDGGNNLDDDNGGNNSDEGLGRNTIGIGQEAYIAVKSDGSGSGQFTVSFSGELKGGGATVETTDKFTVKATEASDNRSPEEGVTAVQFPGKSGNPKIFGDVDGTVSVTIHYDTGEEETREVEIGERIHTDSDRSVVRIDIDDVGTFSAADKENGNKVPR